MVTAPAAAPSPSGIPSASESLAPATPFDAGDRYVLQEVSLRAELLSRKLELLRVIGTDAHAPELRKLEGLLSLVSRQIDELLTA